MLKTRRPWLLALTAVLFASPVFAGDDSEAEDKKWDIDHPPYPTFEQSIDTTTGTWMSLDVSPDGRSIAFDLLGDLYTMPIAGGEATRITSGLSWDMQPRFSPDGGTEISRADLAAFILDVAEQGTWVGGTPTVAY